MRIDCHCHVFSKDQTPFWGMLKNRFRELYWGSAFDHQDKDNIAFILSHIVNYYAELQISKLPMEDIAKRLLEKSEVDICVPLMMNFDHAYQKSIPKISFTQQRDTMIKLTLAEKGRIMPFFAFDPRADLLLDDQIQSARKAIEEQGFAGIKLYPSLGYAPIHNYDPVIDGVLQKLYTFCCVDKEGNQRAHPIPITVHCSWCAGAYSSLPTPTGETNKKKYYRDLAHPKYWKDVLQQFPRLKVNLAHFGGLGEWEALSRNIQPDEVWSETICELIRQYENVYTDISFNGLPHTRFSALYAKLLNETINGIEDKILFGTDWYMSRAQCSLSDYYHSFQKVLSPLRFSLMESSNAIAFLQSDATKTYLPDFFARHQTDLIDFYYTPFK